LNHGLAADDRYPANVEARTGWQQYRRGVYMIDEEIARVLEALEAGYVTAGAGAGAATLLVCPVDGSAQFDGSNALTACGPDGATDAALGAATVSARAADPTEGPINVGNTVLTAKPVWTDSWRQIIVQYDFSLYDTWHRDGTFDGPIHMDLSRLIDLDHLLAPLQELVIARATLTFQREIKQGAKSDQMLQQELAAAERTARHANNLALPVNLNHTHAALSMRGDIPQR
jgi:hypothetical protein